jgi:hypothetical protein
MSQSPRKDRSYSTDGRENSLWLGITAEFIEKSQSSRSNDALEGSRERFSDSRQFLEGSNAGLGD